MGRIWYAGTMDLPTPARYLMTSVLAVPDVTSFVEWVRFLAPFVLPGLITAIVVGGFSLLFNNRLERLKRSYSEELLRLSSDLNRSIQKELETDRSQRTEDLEHLKKDLQDTLASRARRAEYLKAQITNLYGPLAFTLEQGEGRFLRARRFLTAGEYLTNPNNKENRGTLTQEDHATIKTIFKEYLNLGSQNTNIALTLLSTQWGWLDEDDRPRLADFIKQAEHIDIENKNTPPPIVFDPKVLGDKHLEKVTTDFPGLVAHIRKRLSEKQKELSGLTEYKATTEPTNQTHFPIHSDLRPSPK